MLQAHLTLLTSVARDLFSFNPAPDSDLAAPLDSFVEVRECRRVLCLRGRRHLLKALHRTFSQPVPFVHLVRLMVLCGRISNVLNSRQGKHRPLARKKPPSPTELAELQSQLVEFYRSIPSGLAWSVENLQRYEARGLGVCLSDFFASAMRRSEANIAHRDHFWCCICGVSGKHY